MAGFTELYKKYSGLPTLDRNSVEAQLSQYVEQFDIKYVGDEVSFGKSDCPINSVCVDKIRAIVDEGDKVYVVLEPCIFTLNKATGEVRINFDNL